ncbi:unnamed protein product, partial [Mesorhabditis spiculigera]
MVPLWTSVPIHPQAEEGLLLVEYDRLVTAGQLSPAHDSETFVWMSLPPAMLKNCHGRNIRERSSPVRMLQESSPPRRGRKRAVERRGLERRRIALKLGMSSSAMKKFESASEMHPHSMYDSDGSSRRQSSQEPELSLINEEHEQFDVSHDGGHYMTRHAGTTPLMTRRSDNGHGWQSPNSRARQPQLRAITEDLGAEGNYPMEAPRSSIDLPMFFECEEPVELLARRLSTADLNRSGDPSQLAHDLFDEHGHLRF